MALKSLNSFRLQENSETAYHMWESYIPLYNLSKMNLKCLVW